MNHRLKLLDRFSRFFGHRTAKTVRRKVGATLLMALLAISFTFRLSNAMDDKPAERLNAPADKAQVDSPDVGDTAPELNPVAWVDAAGKTTSPALDGKIVVIDFWGIGCGPCVAQLPDVNTAAKHFADSKIAIVGLHDSGGTPERVAEFARKRGLVFPTAIDNEDPAGQSFGATFTAFGVIGIPSSVVIDQNGKVAHIGQFEQAIEIANQLAREK